MGPRLVRETIETDDGGAAAKYHHWSEKQWRWGLFTACYAFGPLGPGYNMHTYCSPDSKQPMVASPLEGPWIVKEKSITDRRIC